MGCVARQPAYDPARVLGKIIYWVAVLAVSIALVIALILWFESQDASDIENSQAPAPVRTAA